MAAATARPPADQELLHQARFWEAHDRGDLAQLALKKLVATRPDLPEPLVQLGEWDLRLNDFASAAQVESELNRRFAPSSAAKDFTEEIRVATRDRLQFASIRRLIELGRGSEATAQLHKLFPHGPPGGALGIEYSLIEARTPGGVASATVAMRDLLQRHPDDPRYQLGLAQLLVRQSQFAAEGVALVQQLTARDDLRLADADRVLASGLTELGPDRAPRAVMDAYLARHPSDAEIARLRTEQQRETEDRELASNVSLSRALPMSQRVLARYLAAKSSSAPGQAEARHWLERSRVSADIHLEARAASELRAALAFYRGGYESQIGVIQELESLGAPAEAGELLTSAAQLAPQSTWLFETRVRWLIGHGNSDTAVGLLQDSAPPAKLSAASRAALLAEALDARAAEEIDSGQLDAAMTDLERATQLAPRDAWIRYRLAELYRGQGEAERGLSLMRDGAHIAPDEPDLRYAEALYLEHVKRYQAAYVAIDAVDPRRRTEGMNALRDRMIVAVARADARRLQEAGDLQGARAALLSAEPVATKGFDAAAQLAYSWISFGDSEHGLSLVRPYVEGQGTEDPKILFGWAEVLNSAEEDVRLRTALTKLRTMPSLHTDELATLNHMQRDLDLREIRALERQRNYIDAAHRLGVLLVSAPQDRQLRIVRAELDLMTHDPHSARDHLASLVAEDPDDLDTRLSYVRALTESGDIALAHAQLQSVEARMPGGDDELQISLARRQLALGDAATALHTLQPLLDMPHPRSDVLMLAGHAEYSLRQLPQAHDYFVRAAQNTTGDDALAARQASLEVEIRLQSSLSAGMLVWHQPGEPGMSQIDAVTIPSAWSWARDDGSRFIARADAVWLDSGRWTTTAQSPLLLGTIQAAGPNAPVRYTSTQQAGLSPGLGFQTDNFAADIGATPLGFLLPNVVGGVEWSPSWHSIDWALGVARRAVTSSELSYAGLKDPVTGTSWGGVVQTGPYAGFGIYRENYDVSGSLRFAEITGSHVSNNQLFAAHLGSNWTFLSVKDTRADAGLALTYWNYERNLSNYTFGSGGYYSPQSYVSFATPIELTGNRAGWSYRLRGAVSYTISQVSEVEFYPNAPGLQAQGSHAPLPPGYSSPYFPGYHSSGFGFSAYAAAERPLSERLVVGLALNIDRTDYYHPTSISIYFRHAFGPLATHTVSPPRPTAPYNP